MTPVLIFSPGYDFSMFGLEWLHPFDGRKFSRAFSLLQKKVGANLDRYWQAPSAPVRDEELLRVHTQEYLHSLHVPSVVAKALEIPLLRMVPRRLIKRSILTPMRLAVAGTILTVQRALERDGAMVMNLGGGFHHAFRDHGEGFCLYADVAVAIAAARERGTLKKDDPILVIDLDAHRGNGVWDVCGSDPAVHVFDLYNFQNYPGLFPGDDEAFPFQIPLKAHTADGDYLDTLREELPKFLASVPHPRLAIYNAGTDIVVGDLLGRLSVSPEGVEARDKMVLGALADRHISTGIVTSGGYTARSHELIAQLALAVIEKAT